jgi:hypothetical protein
MTTVSLIADGDDLILPLSVSVCEDLGWTIGDTVVWTDNNDGSFSLTKADTVVQSKSNGDIDYE